MHERQCRRLPLLLLIAALALTLREASAASVDPWLEARLVTSPPGARFRVFVLLADQLDHPGEPDGARRLDDRQRRRRVVEGLRSLARETQAPLLARLAALRPAGEVGEVTSLWIANALIAELGAGAIRRLAGDSAVAAIHEIRSHSPGEATDDLPAPPLDPSMVPAIEPNIELIEAPALWQRGYTGQSKIVANIDTGTNPRHPDLEKRIWRNIDEVLDGTDSDGNGFVDDLWGWDFESNDNDPRPDGDPHGTNTAGIVVGDGTGPRRVGVAPGASLMILKACGESLAMQAIEYAVDNGADAITSSCSYKFPFRPFYEMWRIISRNTLLAGVPHSNSIGNQGLELGTHPIPYNISAPGITPPSWLHPDQTLVGDLGSLVATGGIEIDLRPYVFSGHGPSAWEDIRVNYPNQRPIGPAWWDYPWANGTMQGLLRPDVVMPTNVITTSIVPGGYTSFGGTSASAPHTGGALALLLSAAPNAAPSDLSEALQSFVTDLGAPGKDNDFGAGLPDLARAAGFLVPEVTPIAEPYGQAIDAGEAIALRLQWINNTSAAVTVWRRITLHHGGVSETVAGPSDLTVPAGGTVSANWHFAATGTLSGELIEIEVAVDAGRGGPPVASTTVQAFVR